MNFISRISTQILFCILLLFTAHGSLPAADIEEHSYFSDTLQRVTTYGLYKPTPAAVDERFPVLYILHGAYGSWHDWPNNSNLADLAKRYRMILVMPDGGQFGWYVDSPTEKTFRYETFITKELRERIDSENPTIDSRDARAIMGLSMGGHGAITLAAKHPDLYGSASSLSGILNITNHPTSWHIADRLGDLESHRDLWEANSAYHLAEKFKTSNTAILFDCGAADDKTLAIGDNRQFHERLTALGIPHIYRENSGGHTWAYWKEHLQEHLNFHQSQMIDATPKAEKWFAHYYKRVEKFVDENAQLAVEGPQTSPTICLLGSSSMEGMPSALFPGWRVYNRGISADRLGVGTRGISQRLEESAIDMKPDVIFLKCGRNDLAARYVGGTGKPTDDELVAISESILTRMREKLPNALIIFGDAFPVRDNYAHLAPSGAVLSERQRELAARLKIPLVDGQKVLIGDDGLAKPENSADGLHLSKAGKAIIAGLILDHVRQQRPELIKRATGAP